MKSLKKALLILLALCCTLFALQGCKTLKSGNKNQLKASIEGKWTLKIFEGKKVADSFREDIPTLEINSEEGLISGNAGCNTYSGLYILKNDILSSPNLVTTLKMCSNENQETEYLKMLSRANKVTLSDGFLTLLSNNGKVIAVFEQTMAKQSIIGEWYLNSMPGEDLSILFLSSEHIPTIKFSREGKTEGNAGCNNYSTFYKIDDSMINIDSLMLTRMACPNLEGETKYIKKLTGNSNFSFFNNDLLFSKEGMVILTFKRK